MKGTVIARNLKRELVLKYPAMAVANEFILKSNYTVSPLKLQKLVYFAHGWCLALTGTALIDEEVEAWPYGPVIDSIYREFKEFGNRNITWLGTDYENRPLRVDPADLNTHKLLNLIWERYGHLEALQLSEMTHRPGSPWQRTYSDGRGRSQVIDNSMIKEFFSQCA